MHIKSFLQSAGFSWNFNLNPSSGNKLFVHVYLYASPAHFKDAKTRNQNKYRTHLGKFHLASALDKLSIPSKGMVVFQTHNGNVFALDKTQAMEYLNGHTFNSFSL